MDPEQMLKGRMAETLVEDLLQKSGNKVYRFGYEAILQNLTQIQNGFEHKSEAGKRISSIPDFIVIDQTGNPVLLEVKFRRKGELHDDDRERLDRIKSFWNAKIVVVNCFEKPYFRVSDPPYINGNKELVTKPMMEENSWKISPEVYMEFESLVEKYLTQILIQPKTDSEPALVS